METDDQEFDVLREVIRKILAKLQNEGKKRLRRKLLAWGALEMASLCSDAGADMIIASSLVSSLKAKAKIKPISECDNSEMRQNWLAQVVQPYPNCGELKTCLFTGAADLAGVRAKRVVHRRKNGCQLPVGPDVPKLLTAGTSCKDLGRLRRNR